MSEDRSGNRPETLRVRLTVGEMADIREAAGLGGLTVSDWVRDRVRRLAAEELLRVKRLPRVLGECGENNDNTENR